MYISYFILIISFLLSIFIQIHHIEPRHLGTQTAISNSYNPGRAVITIYQRNNTEHIPTPPLRWDSRHVTRTAPIPRMEQSGSNAIEPHHHTANVPAPVQIINNNRRHTKSKSRPRSGGSSQHHQEARASLPLIQHRESNSGLIIVNDGVPAQPRLRANSGGCLPVVIMRQHRVRPPQGNRVSTASQTSLDGNDNNASSVNSATNTESINVGDRVIPSIPCSVSHDVSTIVMSQCANKLCSAVKQRKKYGENRLHANNDDEPSRVSVKSKSGLMNRKASSSSGSVSGPTSTSVPSNNKSSSSNERLTGTSSSQTSRDSAVGRRHRQRHSRHTGERRRVSSSTTCSTSPTESSSRSSTSGSFGHGRRTLRFISTSSSSDSEDQRHPPPRRMIARMANGAVRHEMLDTSNGYGCNVGVQREHRHRKSTGSSASTPPRGRPKHKKTNGERVKSSSNRQTNISGPLTRNHVQMAANQAAFVETQPTVSSSVTATTCANTGEQIHLRQKRPNSLNLRLSRKSHPAVQSRLSHPASLTFVEESDPWIHKDTRRTYTSVGVQSTPDQIQKCEQSIDSKSKESQIATKLITTTMDNPPPEIQSAVSAPTPSTTDPDMSSVPKPKPRPKSMVELSQDTSIIVSRFLKQSINGLSPAIKTVLEDIQSVISSDEQYLAEALQSHTFIDEYIDRSNSVEKLSKEKNKHIHIDPELPETKVLDSSLPSPHLNSKDLLKQRLEEKCEIDVGVVSITETKFRSQLSRCRPDWNRWDQT